MKTHRVINLKMLLHCVGLLHVFYSALFFRWDILKTFVRVKFKVVLWTFHQWHWFRSFASLSRENSALDSVPFTQWISFHLISVCSIPRFPNPRCISWRFTHKRSIGWGSRSASVVHEIKCYQTKATSTTFSWNHHADYDSFSQSKRSIHNTSRSTIPCQSDCTSLSNQSKHSLLSQSESSLSNQLVSSG